METTFTNELGNEISLSIQNGTMAEGSRTIECVVITMKGQDSTMENMITLKEAKELQSMLTKFIEYSRK